MKRSFAQQHLNSVQAWVGLANECHFDSELMAERCKITVRQLERQCKKVIGQSPQEWLDEQRMLKAQHLLVQLDTVKSVAYQLGYKQESHFCRAFKKYHAMTPSEYVARRSARNQA